MSVVQVMFWPYTLAGVTEQMVVLTPDVSMFASSSTSCVGGGEGGARGGGGGKAVVSESFSESLRTLCPQRGTPKTPTEGGGGGGGLI